MITRFGQWLTLKYPQSYLIRNPYAGGGVFMLFGFLFLELYRPLSTSSSGTLSYEETMALYILPTAFGLTISIKLLKTIPYFSKRQEWTIFKELISTLILLLAMGVIVYFLAFFIETSSDRWQISTFLDSCKNAFLVGIIPFSFFSVLNISHLRYHHNRFENTTTHDNKVCEEKIFINSKLKKDNLSFSPESFLYAESDGNYINFYLHENNKIDKIIIRNSMTNVESQLSKFPYLLRTHRAYIVNLKNVVDKQGNASGYRLTLKGSKTPVSVSRQNVSTFDQMWENLCN